MTAFNWIVGIKTWEKIKHHFSLDEQAQFWNAVVMDDDPLLAGRYLVDQGMLSPETKSKLYREIHKLEREHYEHGEPTVQPDTV